MRSTLEVVMKKGFTLNSSTRRLLVVEFLTYKILIVKESNFAKIEVFSIKSQKKNSGYVGKPKARFGKP